MTSNDWLEHVTGDLENRVKDLEYELKALRKEVERIWGYLPNRGSGGPLKVGG